MPHDARKALRKQVARAVCLASGTFPCTEHDPVCAICEAEADAAIAICFEEAEQMTRPPAHMLGSADPYANGYRAACADIAAAIRALKDGA